MALNIKKVPGKKTTVNAADLLATFQKDIGDKIGNFGGALVNSDRVPTGLFPLDLALAGGFPRGKCSIVYGPESSNKTNIVLRAIAMHQLIWPDKVCVFFDVENGFDPEWAGKLGVDTKKLIVIRPDYAEQAVDMIESFLYAEDCGIVAVDSLAALTSTSELEKSAEAGSMGGISLLMGKLYRKTNAALGAAEKAGRYPTLIYINQVTTKIGVMFGDPETMPGGKKPYYQASLILRVYGKNLMDSKISTVLPVLKSVTFIVKKFKVPVLGVSGKFDMATMAHGELKVGQCDDFNTVSEYLKTFGLFEKDPKKGWQIMGQHYDTIAPFKSRIYTDAKFGSDVRESIIDKLVKSGKLIESSEEVADV